MSELRKDLVSGDWIIIAPGRAKRPSDFLPEKKERTSAPIEECPFEDFEASGNVPVMLRMPEGEDWKAAVIPNKFPALTHSKTCAVVAKDGIFEHADGLGQHDLLVFREHEKGLSEMPHADVVTAFEVLQRRFDMLSEDKCLVYTSAFFNWGKTAGASLHHPHIQILTLPIMPPSILHSLTHSQAYWKKEKQCVHCDVIAFEKKKKVRVVYENSRAIAVAPYASRHPFGVTIYPKMHEPSFEKTGKSDITAVVEALQHVLGSMRSAIHDPDFNFFIHTAPLGGEKAYKHYHWHIEIVPKISIPAGFELSTGVLINVVPPESAVELLK